MGRLRGHDASNDLEREGNMYGYPKAATESRGDPIRAIYPFGMKFEVGDRSVAVGGGHDHLREWDVCV